MPEVLSKPSSAKYEAIMIVADRAGDSNFNEETSNVQIFGLSRINLKVSVTDLYYVVTLLITNLFIWT